MKKITAEWTAKAENDFLDAERILRSRNRDDFSNACYHAQQCAEKYLKAVLVERERTVPKVHDLPALLARIVDINPFWDALRQAAEDLTEFGIRSRYPEGGITEKPAAKSALLACRLIRVAIREHLGLEIVGKRKRAAAPRKRTPKSGAKSRPRQSRR